MLQEDAKHPRIDHGIHARRSIVPMFNVTFKINAANAVIARNTAVAGNACGGHNLGVIAVKRIGHSTKPRRCVVMRGNQYLAFRQTLRASDGAMVYAWMFTPDRIFAEIFRTKVRARENIKEHKFKKCSIVNV
jgi:hypothetical protein